MIVFVETAIFSVVRWRCFHTNLPSATKKLLIEHGRSWFYIEHFANYQVKATKTEPVWAVWAGKNKLINEILFLNYVYSFSLTAEAKFN